MGRFELEVEMLPMTVIVLHCVALVAVMVRVGRDQRANSVGAIKVLWKFYFVGQFSKIHFATFDRGRGSALQSSNCQSTGHAPSRVPWVARW
jgi:hypothetical protein